MVAGVEAPAALCSGGEPFFSERNEQGRLLTKAGNRELTG